MKRSASSNLSLVERVSRLENKIGVKESEASIEDYIRSSQEYMFLIHNKFKFDFESSYDSDGVAFSATLELKRGFNVESTYYAFEFSPSDMDNQGFLSGGLRTKQGRELRSTPEYPDFNKTFNLGFSNTGLNYIKVLKTIINYYKRFLA